MLLCYFLYVNKSTWIFFFCGEKGVRLVKQHVKITVLLSDVVFVIYYDISVM